jgi:hypothetical protein
MKAINLTHKSLRVVARDPALDRARQYRLPIILAIHSDYYLRAITYR